MRRSDKGRGPPPASSPLQSWATRDRRKLSMLPKRKPLQAAQLRGDKAVEAICAVIRRIPLGWVATYGQVATMAGMPRRARLVGRVLQPLVVEPEFKDGRETGYYLVSAGEGRRQALRLLAKRKALAKGAPVRCVVDTTNDPAEVSMDENLSREPMHPADQYEAFNDLAERKGYSAEEIGARFGINPDIVRKRLRLGAVAPALLDLYREEVLTLDQVTAFAVNPDPERQMQVYAQLPAQNRQPYAIRRAMTETKVAADDRRLRFVGLDAYVAAGGPVLRDLFTEGNDGWAEDVVLLDRLVAEKLAAIAQEVRDREGWKWASAHLDFPHGHGCGRVFEHVLTRTPEDVAAIGALQAEAAALTDQWGDVEPPPPEVAARFEAIDAELEALGEDYGYTGDEKARAGVLVILTQYGEVRIDRGFVRPEDEPASEAEPEDDRDAEERGYDGLGEDEEEEQSDADDAAAEAEDDESVHEAAGDPAAPLPERVVADLTAHRSAALRDALARDPDLAQVALVHALVSRVFGMGGAATCLDIRWGSRDLGQFGEGVEDSPAGLAIAERHRLWAREMPTQAEDLWAFVVGLDGDSRASLLAHCVSLTLDGVKSWERRPLMVMAHVETLATALDLDMRAYWKPTAARYLDRVTKAQIVAAVTDAVSAEAAGRLSGLKKPEMVAAAEPLLVEAGWLPAVLRTVAPKVEPGADPDPAGPGAAVGPEGEDRPADAAGLEAEPTAGVLAEALGAADALTDEAEPLASLDGVGQEALAQTEAEAAEVEALAAFVA
ncbi:MGMT family protein [uncultured Caulobacter sp.]|uniref:MGMT family protein n=1 Tax=uncultured Caulobacter sp. TaxID=158749 RepID=UPI002623BC4F|nr:MGMT family protein [uncultured Caulobacter sp.]